MAELLSRRERPCVGRLTVAVALQYLLADGMLDLGGNLSVLTIIAAFFVGSRDTRERHDGVYSPNLGVKVSLVSVDIGSV